MAKKKVLITGKNSKVTAAFEAYIYDNALDLEIDKISLRDKDISKLSLNGYDVILHTAGITKSDDGSLSPKEADKYYRINRDITFKLAKRARKEGIRQFIYLSTMMVYGNAVSIGNRFIIYRETIPNPKSHYGRSKLEAEEIYKLSNDDFRVLILREPVIYGESFDGEMMKLSKLARILPIFPKMESTKSWLYQGNLCEFIRIGIDEKLEGIFCPRDKETLTTSQVVKRCAKIQGKKCVEVPCMLPVLWVLSKVSSLVNTVCCDISYDDDLGSCKSIPYQIYDFDDAIKRMLGRNER